MALNFTDALAGSRKRNTFSAGLLSVAFFLAQSAPAQLNSSRTLPSQPTPPAPRSVPSQQRPYFGTAAKSRVVPQSVADRSITPKQFVILPTLPTEFIEELKREDAAQGKPRRVRLGFTRALEQPLTVSSETTAGWASTADGSRVYSVQISSPGALAIRLHLERVNLPPGARLLVFDPASPDPQAVPFTSRNVNLEGDAWMPTVASETVVLECALPPASESAAATFSITELSHYYQPITKITPKATCENDVACYPAWANEASGVAEIVFVDGGFTYQCTGSLINDSDPTTFINYFLTAHHCIGSQAAASTIDFTWFYQDVSCNGPQDNSVDTFGADLLATSSSSDFAFLRMREDPPDGVYYLGWSTAAPSSSDTLTGIHHPQGEAKKISFGNLWGIIPAFWQVQWTSGVTEEGSSGSPLFNADGQIIGQLYGGQSSCVNTTGIDYYGRFDKSFNALSRWLSLSGSYNGLFSESSHVAIESSGFINLRLNPSGTFTASILLAGKRYGFSSQFSLAGSATKVINRPGASPLTIDLTQDTSSGNQITGTVSDGSWTANFTAPHVAFDRRFNPSPWQGTFTLVLPGTTSDHQLPAGNSYATVKVDGSGNVRAVGSLADHTPFSQSVALSANGDWPLYASLGGGKEEVWSWLLFNTNRPNDDIDGSADWIRKQQTKAKFYPDGFTNLVQAIGSIYQKPPAGTSLLALPNGTISFAGGNLPSDFSNSISIAANNKVTTTDTNHLTLTFAPATGLFSGAVKPPGLNRTWPYSGIVFQKQNTGFGYLAGTNETSSVVIGP
jgi:hypothetical protein